MGTTYKVLETADYVIELDEMSNRFSIDITTKTDSLIAEDTDETMRSVRSAWTRRELTMEDMEKLILSMIQVTSYWTDDAFPDRLIATIPKIT